MLLLETLQSSPLSFIILSTVLGLMVGSFLNVVIYRLPLMMQRDWETQCAELKGDTLPAHTPFTLAIPRSACPSCGHKITAAETSPLSVIFLARPMFTVPCAHRNTLPLVELITGLLSALMAWHFGFGTAGMAALVFTWS